jgi:hypothetical protein
MSDNLPARSLAAQPFAITVMAIPVITPVKLKIIYWNTDKQFLKIKLFFVIDWPPLPLVLPQPTDQ